MQLQPYLHYDGRCEEAIEFYKSAVGAEVKMLLHFRDNPDPNMPPNPGTEDKVMHANLQIGESTLLVSDGHCTGKANFQGFAISLTLKSESDAKKFFTALSAGGEVRMPLAKTFFSPAFGMLQDKFGVSWMIYVTQS